MKKILCGFVISLLISPASFSQEDMELELFKIMTNTSMSQEQKIIAIQNLNNGKLALEEEGDSVSDLFSSMASMTDVDREEIIKKKREELYKNMMSGQDYQNVGSKIHNEVADIYDKFIEKNSESIRNEVNMQKEIEVANQKERERINKIDEEREEKEYQALLKSENFESNINHYIRLCVESGLYKGYCQCMADNIGNELGKNTPIHKFAMHLHRAYTRSQEGTKNFFTYSSFYDGYVGEYNDWASPTPRNKNMKKKLGEFYGLDLTFKGKSMSIRKQNYVMNLVSSAENIAKARCSDKVTSITVDIFVDPLMSNEDYRIAKGRVSIFDDGNGGIGLYREKMLREALYSNSTNLLELTWIEMGDKLGGSCTKTFHKISRYKSIFLKEVDCLSGKIITNKNLLGKEGECKGCRNLIESGSSFSVKGAF